MVNYLIRRGLQIIIVLFFSAVASYALLNLAPGGPLAGLGQSQIRLNQEDVARIRAYYELDLDLPVRFSRWLIGLPNGPLMIGGQAFFADVIVGCRIRQQVQFITADGTITTADGGCTPGQEVHVSDLIDRPRTSKGVVAGDFGRSWQLSREQPVSNLVWGRLPFTLQLMLTSIGFSIVIAIPLGVISAVRQYSVFDYTVTTLAFFGSSMPTFFFGILMIMLFSIIPFNAGYPLLPPNGATAVRPYEVTGLGTVQADSLTDIVLHMIMPVTVLTLFNVAGFSRFIRASMLEVLRQDYVRTARAKGLLERLVIAKHSLRNALIPFVTIVVFSLPAAFGGAIITESVFNWPGMGRLFFTALGVADYPVAMALLLIIAFLTTIATLLSDVLYTVVDPRIRLG
jgi:peptide/nickel transport system permease protein